MAMQVAHCGSFVLHRRPQSRSGDRKLSELYSAIRLLTSLRACKAHGTAVLLLPIGTSLESFKVRIAVVTIRMHQKR